jgi:hypothetical protein
MVVVAFARPQIRKRGNMPEQAFKATFWSAFIVISLFTGNFGLAIVVAIGLMLLVAAMQDSKVFAAIVAIGLFVWFMVAVALPAIRF